jgi:transmembrane sensor
MPPAMKNPMAEDDENPQREAAAWLARNDRGLSAAEQDEYLQWLRAHPQNAAALLKQERTLRRLEQLSSWQPSASRRPDPDLFAPRRRWIRWALPIAAAFAGAAIWLGYSGWWQPAASRERPSAFSHLLVNELRTLPDGSRVELRNGSGVDVAYSTAERRIRLRAGEAMFTVHKNPARPFVVRAADVAIRAVGTMFDVRLDPGRVQVVVTQGKVAVDRAGFDGAPVYVSAGEAVTISLPSSGPLPPVVVWDRKKLGKELDWQAPRFQFYETPLAEAVAEFNRRNREQLTIADGELRSMPIGGTFRADDVAGFARILEAIMPVRAEAAPGGGFVLRLAR